MKDYTSNTVDELIAAIKNGEDEAYGELFKRIRPITLNEANMYRDKMGIFGMDDLIQEGNILAWQLVGKDRHDPGKFPAYFKVAVRYRFMELFRAYCRNNPVVISETADVDGLGYNIAILGEAEYMETRRAKEREYSRRYYEKKRRKECEEAGVPFKGIREQRSPEDQAKARREQARAYYLAHKDELNRKRTQRRREKREEEKVTAMESLRSPVMASV